MPTTTTNTDTKYKYRYRYAQKKQRSGINAVGNRCPTDREGSPRGSDLRALESTGLRSTSRRAPRAQHSWDPRSTARTPRFGRKMPIHKVRIPPGKKKLVRTDTSERRSPGFGISEGRSPAPPPEMLLKEPNELNVKDLHLRLNTFAGRSN